MDVTDWNSNVTEYNSNNDFLPYKPRGRGGIWVSFSTCEFLWVSTIIKLTEKSLDNEENENRMKSWNEWVIL